MAKREWRPSNTPFEGTPQGLNVDRSWTDLDSQIFGNVPPDTRQHIRQISIFDIIPDPIQPRRAVPSNVRKQWNDNPFMIGDLFSAWLKAVVEERKGEFPLDDYLLVKEGNHDRSEEAGPIETSFMAIIDLALSIRREGLINPVTVAMKGPQRYQLETGERRWLAYHLLHAYFDGSSSDIPNEQNKWGKIPAIEVTQIDVWRQATENTVRANLNAIGKARQFAILMMALHAEQGKTFQPFDPKARSDRAYYAQVTKFENIPYGKRDTLLSAMGVKSPAEFTRCRQLLSLPDEVWIAGDDYNLSQDRLLELADMPAERAIAFVRELKPVDAATLPHISRPYTERRAALITDKDVKTGTPLIDKSERPLHRQRLNELLSLTRNVKDASPETRQEIRQITRDLRKLLDEIDRRVGE